MQGFNSLWPIIDVMRVITDFFWVQYYHFINYVKKQLLWIILAVETTCWIKEYYIWRERWNSYFLNSIRTCFSFCRHSPLRFFIFICAWYFSFLIITANYSLLLYFDDPHPIVNLYLYTNFRIIYQILMDLSLPWEATAAS